MGMAVSKSQPFLLLQLHTKGPCKPVENFVVVQVLQAFASLYKILPDVLLWYGCLCNFCLFDNRLQISSIRILPQRAIGKVKQADKADCKEIIEQGHMTQLLTSCTMHSWSPAAATRQQFCAQR